MGACRRAMNLSSSIVFPVYKMARISARLNGNPTVWCFGFWPCTNATAPTFLWVPKRESRLAKPLLPSLTETRKHDSKPSQRDVDKP